MSRPALAALTLAAVLAAASAPDPCCIRVTPYHIQALAQRMAQRFQALEYRAQDLRYVFASFQAVHGNVTHRLRYLEAEHAHLSEMVSRLDSRLHSLEEEKRMDEYKQRVEYYRRGERSSDIRTSVEDLLKPPARMPYVMRRRREEEETELPHLLVHLEQPMLADSADAGLTSPTNDPTPSAYPANDPVTIRDKLPAPVTSSEPEIVRLDLENVTSEPEVEPSGAERDSAPRSSVFINKGTEASPQLVHEASASDSATTPTPLWQLEETASASLNVMSAGDDDDGVGGGNVPNEAVDDAVSYWSPANETDSLEELFYPKHQPEDPETPDCTGHSTNCSEKTSQVQPTQADGAAIAGTPTEASILDSVVLDAVDNSSGFTHPEDAVNFVPHATAVSENGSTTNKSSGSSAVNVSDLVLKTTGCKTPNLVPPDPPPPDSVGNLTRSLLDMGNSTDPLLDIFSSGADGLANGASPPPDGGGGGEAGCGAAGCDAELSDAELQTALRELDALLQRPPASAQPPDPEKVLLKRALTLALAALERTSDACLKLVNFTADAFEGLAAADA